MVAELHGLGVQHIVIVRENGADAYPHSKQMREALAATDSGFLLKQRLAYQYRPGVTEVYEAAGTAMPDIAAVREMGVPGKAASLSKLQ